MPMRALSDVDFVNTDWSSYTVCYDSLLHLKPYVAMLNKVANIVHASTAPLGPILDASCGTGNLEMVLARLGRNNASMVIGIDSCELMLAQARTKLGDTNRFLFQRADLDKQLQFPDHTFGQIVSINTLYAVNDPKSVLSEFYRVLMPGGRIILINPQRNYENGLILKEHCGSALPDTHWMNVHATPEREESLIREAIKDETVVAHMLEIARFNRSIQGTRSLHFYSIEELIKLIDEVGFRMTLASFTYANQDILLVGTKK